MTNDITQKIITDWFKITSLSIDKQHEFLQELFAKHNDKDLIEWVTEKIPQKLKFHIDVVMEQHNKIINYYYINDRTVSKSVYDFVKFLNTQSQTQTHDYSHEM